MCRDTRDSQPHAVPSTVLSTGKGPWLNTMTRVSPVGLARSRLLPSPTAQPDPLMLPQKLASARRQTLTAPQAGFTAQSLHATPHPWPGFTGGSGEGETPTTPEGRPCPGNVDTSCGETVSGLRNPRMLASRPPSMPGLKRLKPTPLPRRQGKQLGACPSAHPLRAPSCVSCADC